MGSCQSNPSTDTSATPACEPATTVQLVKEKPACAYECEHKESPLLPAVVSVGDETQPLQQQVVQQEQKEQCYTIALTATLNQPLLQSEGRSTKDEAFLAAIKPPPSEADVPNAMCDIPDGTMVPPCQSSELSTCEDSNNAVALKPSDGKAADEEFKNTVKTVLLLLLDRLTRTMEYEHVAFGELAANVGLCNYMDLFDYRGFEKLLRDNFSIPSSSLPMDNDQDGRAVSQHFSLFLSLAQNSTVLDCSSNSNRTFPSRTAFTTKLQNLCAESSSRLLNWCDSPHASGEVREHFVFFAKALEFTRGDLVNNPQLLYSNIDAITS